MAKVASPRLGKDRLVTATSLYAPARQFYDEAIAPDGSLRPDGGRGVAALDGQDLGALCRALSESLHDDGVGFRSVDGTTQFSVCPVPRVLGSAEWDALEPGLAQRVRALNAFVADVYGPRRAVAEGVIPERVIEGSAGYEPQLQGLRPPGDLWIGIAGLDLVRDASRRVPRARGQRHHAERLLVLARDARRAHAPARRPRRRRAAAARRHAGHARGDAALGGARPRGPVRGGAHRRREQQRRLRARLGGADARDPARRARRPRAERRPR